MKKIKLLFLTALSLIMFCGCSKDDDKKVDGNLLIGTWEATLWKAYEKDDNGNFQLLETYIDSNDSLILNEDKTGEIGDGFDNIGEETLIPLKWSLSNKTITIILDPDDEPFYEYYTIESISSSELTLIREEEDWKDVITYRKNN